MEIPPNVPENTAFVVHLAIPRGCPLICCVGIAGLYITDIRRVVILNSPVKRREKDTIF